MGARSTIVSADWPEPYRQRRARNSVSAFNRGKKYYSIFPMNVNRKFERFALPADINFTCVQWILQLFHARALAFALRSYIVTIVNESKKANAI